MTDDEGRQAETTDMHEQHDGQNAENAVETGSATPSMEEMLAELNQVKADASEMLDSLQRSRAEFANFRRRIEQDQERLRMNATERVIRKLLPVADDFDRALRSVPADIADNPWLEGMRLVERKLWNALESEGIRVMESLGQPFDPSRHEAVMVDESAPATDTVVEEFQRGYFANDSVLRPAMVKVGAAPVTAETHDA